MPYPAQLSTQTRELPEEAFLKLLSEINLIVQQLLSSSSNQDKLAALHILGTLHHSSACRYLVPIFPDTLIETRSPEASTPAARSKVTSIVSNLRLALTSVDIAVIEHASKALGTFYEELHPPTLCKEAHCLPDVFFFLFTWFPYLLAISSLKSILE